jgi:hypothetical protein
MQKWEGEVKKKLEEIAGNLRKGPLIRDRRNTN